MHKKRLENLISLQDFGSRHANAPCVHDVNCVLSLSEIAHELGVTDVILKYKLEAMRIRGRGKKMSAALPYIFMKKGNAL